MAIPTLDAELHRAMTQYLMACNRLQIAEERDDHALIAQSLVDQKRAAEDYEQTLVKRGWRAPARAMSTR